MSAATPSVRNITDAFKEVSEMGPRTRNEPRHLDWQSLIQFLVAMIVVVGFFTAVIDRVGDVRNDVAMFKADMSKDVSTAISAQTTQNTQVYESMIRVVEYVTGLPQNRDSRRRGVELLQELRDRQNRLDPDFADSTKPRIGK